MRKSFINPRKKQLISMFSKIWIVFITIIVIFLGAFSLFVTYKTNSYKKNIISLHDQRIKLEKMTDNIDANIGFVLRQKALAEEVYANNIILKDSIKNLFDLVPDQITLNKIIMDKSSLVLYGITPTKDTFNFILATPLKSIFHTSNTIFYLQKNGWYSFVSTNEIIDSFGIKEDN